MILSRNSPMFNEKDNNLNNIILKPHDVYISLYNRGVKQLIDNNPCKTLVSISPSIDWQIKNIKYTFGLSEKDRYLLGFYMGSAFGSLNTKLRKGKAYPTLNEAI